MMNVDEKYMRRALQLAELGRCGASPNPMVGAVIVSGGRIIGEGCHRRAGEAHAEVNAIRSVKPSDEPLLKDSTLYVTLEPCSHYGKTPPCSKLIIEKRIPRVAVGCLDPFKEVCGRGMAMLGKAGVETVSGVLEKECRALNTRFMTAHTLQRPYILLKWAESADRFVDRTRRPETAPATFSTPATRTLVHRLRTEYDAIMIGAGTLRLDDPSLTVREWPGRNPLRIVMSRNGYGQIPDRRLFSDGLPTILFSESGKTAPELPANVTELPIPDRNAPLQSVCRALYNRGVTSVMVEGGPTLAASFLEAGLWDEIRIEQSTDVLGEGVPAPGIPPIAPDICSIDGNRVLRFANPQFQ